MKRLLLASSALLAAQAPTQTVQSALAPDVFAAIELCQIDGLYHFTGKCPSGDVVVSSLAGKSLLVPHDFNTDLTTVSTLPKDSSPDTAGAYRQICGSGFFMYADPALFPGRRGGHLHEFSGDESDPVVNYTPELVIKNGGDSSCNHTGLGHASQRSRYWVAALLNGKGMAVRADFNSVYYKRVPVNSPDCGMPTGKATGPVGICIDDPGGLTMIAGMNPVTGLYTPLNYRTDAARPAYFMCSENAAQPNAKYDNLESTQTANPACTELTEAISFPNCWDGKRTWAVDRSHVVYKKAYSDGQSRCPIDHPYLIVGVSIHYTYTLDGDWKNYGLSCDAMMPGQPRGKCLHADVQLVWDDRVKAMRMGCINGHRNASGGDLCNYRRLKGAAQPVYGFKQPAAQRLVPIPTGGM